MKTGVFGPIREARKLCFDESVSKSTISVELNETGWVHIRQFKGFGGFCGHTAKFVYINLTTEDARNLIACLQELVPSSECEKGNYEKRK